jgi:hypothetical protein
MQQEGDQELVEFFNTVIEKQPEGRPAGQGDARAPAAERAGVASSWHAFTSERGPGCSPGPLRIGML